MTVQTAQRHSGGRPIIPSQSVGVTGLRIHAFLAILTGLALRLLFVFQFEASSDDSATYIQLARNWTDHRIYGLWLNGHLIPTDIRTPGYPAFLAGIAMILGRSIRAITLSQVVIDLSTCFLTAALAAALAPAWVRRRVWIAALWLAGTCTFLANYSAVVLTECLATFLTTAALACFVLGISHIGRDSSLLVLGRRVSSSGFTLLGALFTGLATLVRPEMPLLLVAAGAVYALRFWRSPRVQKLVLLGVSMAGAFLLPVLPWAARNFITLHEVQWIAPRYATLPDEYAPVGYYAWTRTWLERYRDVYFTVWKIGEEPEEIGDLPPRAFDSPEEKARIADLFDRYNTSADLDISPEMDHEFAEIARERTKRHPLRTYIEVPFERALSIWFTPRTEMLPIDGKIWPLAAQWQDSRADVLITAGFAVLGYLYIVLALGGIWASWRARETSNRIPNEPDRSENEFNLWGIALLLAYLVVRTIFLTTVEAPEPRYVLSCYPAVLALIAQWFAGKRYGESKSY